MLKNAPDLIGSWMVIVIMKTMLKNVIMTEVTVALVMIQRMDGINTANHIAHVLTCLANQTLIVPLTMNVEKMTSV